VECVSDFEFGLISPDGAGSFPSKGPTLGEHKVSYPLADIIPCGEYRATLSGEFHNTFFTLADQEIGVIIPVGDFSQSSEELNLVIQGTKMTWTGSACAQSYVVTVTNNNAETVFNKTVESNKEAVEGVPLLYEENATGEESGNGDRITVELENLEKCTDYKAELQTVWKDVSLPSSGQFSDNVFTATVEKLLDANNCRAVSPKAKVKSSSLTLTPVSSASTFDNSVILLLVSSYAIFKVFRV